MKIGQMITTALMAVLLFTTPAWAAGDNGVGVGNRPICPGKSCIKAPEIDVATGALPIALLTGVILLMKERARSRRTPISKN